MGHTLAHPILAQFAEGVKLASGTSQGRQHPLRTRF